MSYIALVLDEQSKLELLKRCSPKHSKVFAHHITLVFSPTAEVRRRFVDFLGKREFFEICVEVSDSKGHAVSVKLGDELPCYNNQPHVTISCAEGTKPVYSNELLKRMDGTYESKDLGNVTLCGTVQECN